MPKHTVHSEDCNHACNLKFDYFVYKEVLKVSSVKMWYENQHYQ